MAGKYFCEGCGAEMDLSIDNKCPACGRVANPSQKSSSTTTTTSESYDKATFGLDQNVASALCYVLGWLTGILFILVEKENKVVRFHAMQSIIVFLSLGILGWIIGAMFMGSGGYYYSSSWGFWSMVTSLIFVIEIILWLVLIIKAYQGETFQVPIAGQIAAKQLE